MSKKIAFTTSLPVEVILAAGHIPIDLNNVFITMDSAAKISRAELMGFPRTICSWIKGNYIAALECTPDEVIGVVQGDCSNTHSILDLLEDDGISVYHFSFPPHRSYEAMNAQIQALEEHFEVSRSQSLAVKKRLDIIRKKLCLLDQWTYKERLVSGEENHYWLVNSSDFWGNPDFFEEKLDAFMHLASQRDPLPNRLRIAYLGVPPVYQNLYGTISSLGGDVIFNEVQRQFAMPYLCEDIVDQYLRYTYPYSINERWEDICKELQERSIEAVISYTQSFCHLQIDNLLLKRRINIPMLTLEGDQPESIDSRTLLRLESFMEIHSPQRKNT